MESPRRSTNKTCHHFLQHVPEWGNSLVWNQHIWSFHTKPSILEYLELQDPPEGQKSTNIKMAWYVRWPRRTQNYNCSSPPVHRTLDLSSNRAGVSFSPRHTFSVFLLLGWFADREIKSDIQICDFNFRKIWAKTLWHNCVSATVTNQTRFSICNAATRRQIFALWPSTFIFYSYQNREVKCWLRSF